MLTLSDLSNEYVKILVMSILSSHAHGSSKAALYIKIFSPKIGQCLILVL